MEVTWDYACKIAYSQIAAYYEISTRFTLVTFLVNLY